MCFYWISVYEILGYSLDSVSIHSAKAGVTHSSTLCYTNRNMFEAPGFQRQIGFAEGTTEEQWLQLNCMGGGEAKALACQSPSSGRSRWVPWVGVALKFGTSSDSGLQLVPGVRGQAFSFLPLPVETGLPGHINAVFELSDSRRDIIWGDDMRGSGKAKVAWNRALLVVPLNPDSLSNTAQNLANSGHS